MKRIVKKALLKTQKPILIEVDPYAIDQEIFLPKLEYKIVANITKESTFNGNIIPLPRVLVYFLTRNELLIMSAILEETITSTWCLLTITELSRRIGLATPTVSNTLYKLRGMGLLLEAQSRARGNGRIRRINFETVQHLNDLVQGENPQIYARIRSCCRKKDINNITKEDLQQAYNHIILPPEHDPEEEEEYN